MGYQQTRMPGGRWSRHGYMRHMRTTQERRHWDAEYGRASRNRKGLPDAYDDFLRYPQRSWKEQRATQYREVYRSGIDDRSA